MILSKVFSLEFITLVLIKGSASETFQPSVKVTDSKSQLRVAFHEYLKYQIDPQYDISQDFTIFNIKSISY